MASLARGKCGFSCDFRDGQSKRGSVDMKSSLFDEEEGRRVDLNTNSGETICLSFPDNGAPLPKVIKLVDPDNGKSMLFESNDSGYREIAGTVHEVLNDFNFELCLNCRNEEANGPNELRRQNSNDERLQKQREKLQKKLKERKGNKNEDCCASRCHQMYMEIPIQGLSQIREDSYPNKSENNSKTDGHLLVKKEEQISSEDLKIQKAPEVEVTGVTSVKISWLSTTKNLPSDCTFELQMATRNNNYDRIYSGGETSAKKGELKPGGTYKLRVCAVKGKIKGDYSPEAQVQIPSTAPDAPSVPYISNKSKTSFQVKWNAPYDNGSPIKTYILQWDKGADDGQYHEVTNGLQRQHKLFHKLPPGTKCVFRVKAVNEIGESQFSKDLITYTSASVPDAPNAPTLESTSSNFIAVKWNKPECNGAEISEYLLEVEDPSGAYGFMVNYRGSENRHKTDKLKRNTTYNFRISAINSQGTSKSSDISSFTTAPERPGRPSPPTLQGKPKTTSFTVSWGKPDDTGGTAITKYSLEIDNGEGGEYKQMYCGPEQEYTVSNLRPGHVYKVRVQCHSEGGASEWSHFSKIRTLAVSPGQAKAPLISRAYKPQSTALHLYWDPPEYNGGSSITAYMLSMEVEKAGTTELCEIYCGADNLCTVSGLQPGKTYSFCIKAANEAGVGEASVMAELSTEPGAPDAPNTPDIVCRTAAAIQVTWEAASENGSPVTGYTLEMMENEVFVEVYSGVEKCFELRRGLNPASYYYFRVKALSHAGPSLYSAVGTCYTPAASPAAVSYVRVVAQSTSHLRLRWRHPANNGAPITSYNIEITGVRNISYDLEDESKEAEESQLEEYDVSNLQPNTLYRIRVQAVNKIGCGPFSPQTVGTTLILPPPPPGIELASASYQSLKLRWGSASNKDSLGLTYFLKMKDSMGNFQTIFNGSTTSHKIGKLRERTGYEFQIQAGNDAGTGPISDVYCFSTTAQPPSPVKGLVSEYLTENSCRISWDAVPCITKSDNITYLLQYQAEGKDFQQVYLGSERSFLASDLISGCEYIYRACAIRLTETQDEIDQKFPHGGGIKGSFSPVLTIKSGPLRNKQRTSELESREDYIDTSDNEEIKQLSDYQWAMIFFVGFTLFALGLAFIGPMLFDLSE